MQALKAPDLLMLWERGAPRHALDRGALLGAWARPDLPADAVADLPLGELNQALLQLHEASFGAQLQAHVDCERCGQRLALSLDLRDLLQPTPAPTPMPAGDSATELWGLRLRAPCLRDLAAVALVEDAREAARQLLARCTLQGDAQTLDDVALREVEDALETLDPNADMALAMHCTACGAQQVAQLDAAVLLWDQIAARSRALLGEVHQLARAYGWTESDILALSDARRAAYLAMVEP